MKKILVIGAGGQLGLVLTRILQERYGINRVVASDIRQVDELDGHFETLDATDLVTLKRVIAHHKIKVIYHLAAILSAVGERSPLKTMEVNMRTLTNVLEASRLMNVERIFFPSSIAVFGPDVRKEGAPQHACLNPQTVYGVSKVSGENWANYCFHKYGLDIRSIRYPGLISYQSKPGGGTTDYAVDIFRKAVKGEKYECFLKKETQLPLMYMDDAVRATIELMEAPSELVRIRTSYNLGGFSCSPDDLANIITKKIPDFQVTYRPDFRQSIADTWPSIVDDQAAQNDWGWKPQYDMKKTAQIMLDKLQSQEVLLKTSH